ncbi:phosphoserine aminotransferase [Gonapodya prolifera JEL478]|uniref:phosphoserine transaminase n=1 Tax=Gonapodya prolifera (strain JEL478) TaxID=1344416 RepID=A0A139A8R0_GONPJ|nr:phosphoserine aminotransferase [Gonapodya prolifera JEL478]|eukprot:KXS12773.1 phosphoserine aminotransferase [Gonapodya prolifera JEL478]
MPHTTGNGHAEKRVWNFSPGPAAIHRDVLSKVQEELLDFEGSGMSAMELSPLFPAYDTMWKQADKDLRELLVIPDDYAVLWMQGGATMQFSAVVFNLLGDGSKTADYFGTGNWSERAIQEARRLGANVNAAIDTRETGYSTLPPKSEWKLTPASECAYLHYCLNETVSGVEWFEIPDVDPSVPLVCDASSTILSRPIDVARHAVIYAGCQKNFGPTGSVVVIIRKDLIGARPFKYPFPSMLDYKIMADYNSMWNTPATFPIYVGALVFKWLKEQGGLTEIEKIHIQKATRLYGVIDALSSVFYSPVQRSCRSRMNVVFRILGKDGKPDPDLEAGFLKDAVEFGLQQLKGHRTVGGVRASIYNGMPIEGVEALASYMEDFAATIKAR